MTDEQNPISSDQLQAQLEAVYASTSWKITAPLRMLGSLAIASKQWLRLVAASPRAALRRSAAALVKSAIPMIKRSAVLMRLAARVRTKYPDAWERNIQPFRLPAPITAESPAVQQIAATFDPPYAWNGANSPANHFKHLLSRELQQRKNKQSEYS